MPPAHDFADRSAIRRSLLNGDTLRQTRRTLFSVSLGVVAKKHVMHVVEPRLPAHYPARGAQCAFGKYAARGNAVGQGQPLGRRREYDLVIARHFAAAFGLVVDRIGTGLVARFRNRLAELQRRARRRVLLVNMMRFVNLDREFVAQ